MFLAVAPSESVVLTHVTEHAKLLPGKAHSPAGSVGVTEDASGNGLAEGLQHVLQLLLVHGHGQVWDVKVGGVLLLLLNGEKQGEDSRMRIRTSPFKKKTKKTRSHRKSCWQELCEMYDSWMSWQVQDITVWEKRVWNWRWISLWPCMRESELRERRESRSSEMEEIVFWLGWTSTSLSFCLTMTVSSTFLTPITPFSHSALMRYYHAGRRRAHGETGLWRGWKRGIQVMWYQSVITFPMALQPRMIEKWLRAGESQQRRFGRRPLEMIWRTSEALCYHPPAGQTLSSSSPGRGNKMSLVFKQ